MKKWKVIYTFNKEYFQETVIIAATYTKALLKFVIKYPNAEYKEIAEVIL